VHDQHAGTSTTGHRNEVPQVVDRQIVNTPGLTRRATLPGQGEPSGAERAATSIPMVPAAPPRFSINDLLAEQLRKSRLNDATGRNPTRLRARWDDILNGSIRIAALR